MLTEKVRKDNNNFQALYTFIALVKHRVIVTPRRQMYACVILCLPVTMPCKQQENQSTLYAIGYTHGFVLRSFIMVKI